MNINLELLKEFQDSQSKILAVTKYFSADETNDFMLMLSQLDDSSIIGYGENRIDHIVKKQIPRNRLHFIGNIQSQKIASIIEYCSTIHSVGSEKHLKKIQNMSDSLGLYTEVFLQARVDDSKDIGCTEEEIASIICRFKASDFCKITGISGMGKAEYSLEEKQKEFQYLIYLRDKYVSHGKISAGTSRDYHIALGAGIDIVRIGTKLIEP